MNDDPSLPEPASTPPEISDAAAEVLANLMRNQGRQLKPGDWVQAPTPLHRVGYTIAEVKDIRTEVLELPPTARPSPYAIAVMVLVQIRGIHKDMKPETWLHLSDLRPFPALR